MAWTRMEMLMLKRNGYVLEAESIELPTGLDMVGMRETEESKITCLF